MSKVILSSIIDIISGGTPSTSNSQYWDNGTIGWLSINDFNNGNRYVYESEKKITELAIKESNTKLLNKNDIIISARGTVGVLSQIGTPMCFNQSCFGIRAKIGIAHNTFLYYSLKNYISNIKKRSQGSVFDTINLKSFDLMEIEIPAILEQEQIASVLSSLDDKIELNNRINAELEAMAKTLYDYWFVQFDFPDANGKPYKSSGGKMVYNVELKREIPEGWEVKLLGDEFETLLGGTPSTENKSFWENGTINWLNSGEIANFPIITSELSITQDAIRKSSTNMLPKGSVLLSITRHLRTTILAIDACINQSVVGIKPKSNIKSNYLYPYMKNEIPRLMGLRTGAQQPHINKDIVDKSYIILPKISVINLYNERTEKIYDLIIDKAKENQALASLRDWLLPMLMNGQVGFEEEYQTQTEVVNMAAEPMAEYNPFTPQNQRFELWLSNQGLAARGEIDRATLREIFNVMDEEEYGE